jgi:hypothetical protein
MFLANGGIIQSETIPGKLAASAIALYGRVKAGATTESGAASGPHLLFVDAARTLVHSIRPPDIRPFVDAYLEHSWLAGEALARGIFPEAPRAPPFFGCTRTHPGIFSIQFGPFDLAEPHKVMSHSIIDALARIIAGVCRTFCPDTYTHEIYFGISAPPRGPGLTTVFAWIPSLRQNRHDTTRVKIGITEIFGARYKSKAVPLYTDDRGAPIVCTSGTPVTDKDQESSLKRTGWVAGTNGVVPLLWCAAPSVNGGRETFPILPFVGYATFWADDNEGTITQEYAYNDTLLGCADPRAVELVVSSLGGAPRVEHDDTDGMRIQDSHRDPLVRAIGCRAPGDPRLSTYDTLPLVILTAYVGDGSGLGPGELQERIFDTCLADTRDKFEVSALLGLLSKDRYNTSRPEELAVLGAVLDGLIQHNMLSEGCGIDSATSAAMNTMVAAAAARCADNFDRDALARHHVQNYADRPHKSRRIVSYYAQTDTPQNFSHLFATRIWALLMNVGDSKQVVNLAEALAAYLSHTHYIVMDKVKLNSKIYFFNGYSYEDVGSVSTYLTGLLSQSQGSDQRPGKLRNIIAKFTTRLNSLVSETRAPAESGAAGSGSGGGGGGGVPQAYLARIVAIYNKIDMDLGTPNYKNQVISEILTKLDQDQTQFLGIRNRRIDDDPYLTGVKNGVLEVVRIGKRRHVVFRPATQEDMTPPGINAKYDPNVRGTRKWDHIERYFNRFIASDRIREWYLCFLSETFVGKGMKVALFIQGPTESGKSAHIGQLHGFLRKPYAESIGGNTLNDPNIAKDTPQPALVRAIGARITTVEETSAVIMNTPFKILVGGEEGRSAFRSLFEGGESGTIRTTFIFAVNSPPKFELLEAAIFTRLAILRPDCRFVAPNNPMLPATPEEREARRIFPRDGNLSNSHFRDAYDAFLLYLIDHFDTWTDDAGNPAGIGSFPREMEPMRDDVRRQDPYADFIGRNVIAAAGDMSISVADVVKRFQKAYNKNGATYTSKAIVAGIGQILSAAAVNGEYWRGWALIPEKEVDRDGAYQGLSLVEDVDPDQSFHPYTETPSAYFQYQGDMDAGDEDGAFVTDPDDWSRNLEGGSGGSLAGAVMEL